MTTSRFIAGGAPHGHEELGPILAPDIAHVIWGHGWGRSRADFLPLARSLERRAHHTVLDFPGFGDSPRPREDWGTEAYADALAEWLRTQPARRRIYVGHSFGSRVGLRLAARHPDLLDAMVLVAGAGLQRRRSAWQRLKIFARVRAFKALKLVERLGLDVSRYRSGFGSADYRDAGAMRPIFVKTVREDQTDVAKAIRCPVVLLYGEHDTETPPEFGTRLQGLIPGARLAILPGLDHLTVLTDGAPQVVNAVAGLLEAPLPGAPLPGASLPDAPA